MFFKIWLKKNFSYCFCNISIFLCSSCLDVSQWKIIGHINRIHKKDLRIVCQDHNSTFDELLAKEASLKVHDRNLQKLLIEIFKVSRSLLPKSWIKFLTLLVHELIPFLAPLGGQSITWITSGCPVLEEHNGLSELVVFVQNWGILLTRMNQSRTTWK